LAEEKKKLLITAGRRIIFAGLSLYGAWMIILWLRSILHPPYDMGWEYSWLSGLSVNEMINLRLGYTVQLILFGALLSLTIAVLLLLLIFFINRAVENNNRDNRIWQILRTVIISGSVSTPIFWVITGIVICLKSYKEIELIREFDGAIYWWPVFFISLFPAWLLIQACYEDLEKNNGSHYLLVRNLGVKLIVTLLKLMGTIIVLDIIVELIFQIPGLGRQLYGVAAQRDFPVVFGITWIFVVIVVVSRLAAELMEIFYQSLTPQQSLFGQSDRQTTRRTIIPKDWLIICLVLVFISIVFAVIAPVFAPYPVGEIHLSDRLGEPSSEYRLGTDQMGRDLLSQLIYAVRTDMQIGFMCVGVFLVVVIGWAILAVRFKQTGDWLDDTIHDLIMLPRDVVCAFPWLILILILMSMYGRGFLEFTIIGGLVLLPRAVSMMKEAYSSLFEEWGWIDSFIRSVPVMIIFAIAGSIIYISSAGFLGFGVPPGTPELGSMLTQEGRKYMELLPQLVLLPGIVLTLLIFIWVLAGNTLLEYLNFKSRSVWLKVFE
jgi:peptide/nickel transport system permease protein